MNNVEILRKAKERIGTPERWMKGDHFAVANWNFNNPPENCPACMLGAMIYARKSGTWSVAHDQLEKVISFTFIDDFNDHPDTTHQDVMEAFDRAIKLAEKENET